MTFTPQPMVPPRLFTSLVALAFIGSGQLFAQESWRRTNSTTGEEHERRIREMRERGEQIRQRLADEYRQEQERLQRERREAWEKRQAEARANAQRFRFGYGTYTTPARFYPLPSVTPDPGYYFRPVTPVAPSVYRDDKPTSIDIESDYDALNSWTARRTYSGRMRIENDYDYSKSYTYRPTYAGRGRIENDYDAMDTFTVRPTYAGRFRVEHDYDYNKSYTLKPRALGGYTLENDYDPLDTMTVRPRGGGGFRIDE
jgi:hypothetical protein